MKRIFKIAIVAISCIVLWLALLLHLAPRLEQYPDWVFDTVFLTPLIAAGAFALYLLFCLVPGVKAFKTVPEESENLQQDIARAKEALESKGVSTESKKDE